MRETAKLLHLDSLEQVVTKGLVALAIVLALAFWGSGDATHDEIIARTAGIALVALLFPIVYLYKWYSVPASMANEEAARYDELRMAVEPNVDFMWRENDNKFLEAGTARIHGRNVRAKMGRVAVKNMSLSTSRSGIEVSLIHYIRNGEVQYTTVAKKLIANSIGQAVVELHSMCEETFNVFFVQETNNRAYFGRFADGTLSNHLEPGAYKVKITASGRDMRRIDRYYLLEFRDYAHVMFRPWKVGDTEHPPVAGLIQSSRAD
jgi:hypothetical protein